jgi:superfamily II DNA or RNA helicase
LCKNGKIPYPYQLEILDVIDKHDRGIIKVATGGGKSLIAGLITAKLGKKTIIYVIGKDLLYQFHTFFSECFEEPIGIIGDGQCQIHDINIASIWTIGQAIGMKKNEILLDSDDGEEKLGKDKYANIIKMMKECRVHIIDECHMSACETIQQVFKKANSEHIYGLSGSPWRDDGADLLIESILGKYIVNIPASRLIKEGYLAKAIIRFRVVPPYPYELEKSYPSIYKKYVVENDVRNGLVLEAAKVLVDKGYQTLVLFSSLKHGKILYELFQEHMNCAILDGSNDKDERQRVKQDLQDRKIDCVLASRIFDIGVDIPSLAGLVIACGGKSTVKALQRVGRVIRRYPSKTQAVIIDFLDQATYLDNHSRIRHKIYTSEDGFDVSWPIEVKKSRRKKNENF